METEAVPFRFEHIKDLRLNPTNIALMGMVQKEDQERLEKMPFNYTLLVQGRAIACGGVVQYWASRGEVWSILDEDIGRRFIWWHRCVVRFLSICAIKRLEAVVEKSYEPGHRWAKMLGFECEAPVLKHYYPDGRDGVLYVKIQRGG